MIHCWEKPSFFVCNIIIVFHTPTVWTKVYNYPGGGGLSSSTLKPQCYTKNKKTEKFKPLIVLQYLKGILTKLYNVPVQIYKRANRRKEAILDNFLGTEFLLQT